MAPDGAIRLIDIRPGGVFSETKKNAASALVGPFGEYDQVTFPEELTH